jgi:hypothetical protein
MSVSASNSSCFTAYGYNCSAVPAKNTELLDLADGAAWAIEQVHNTTFVSGPICKTIYPATGCSVDYVNDVAGAEYTFTTELRDGGLFGFVLPPEQIIPSGEEAFAGLRFLLENMN